MLQVHTDVYLCNYVLFWGILNYMNIVIRSLRVHSLTSGQLCDSQVVQTSAQQPQLITVTHLDPVNGSYVDGR